MASVAVVAATTLVSSGANAVTFGPYNIDGLVPDGTPPAPPPPVPSMQHLPDFSGNVKELGPKNGSPTKITVIHTAATPMLEVTNPNGQVDLKNAWIDLKRQNNNDFLYFAWERDSNTGSGFIAFEFMKNGLPAGCTYDTSTNAQLIANCNPWKSGTNPATGRSAGDFLILWDQSGSSAVLSKRVWTQAGANAPLVLGAPVLLSSDPTKASGVYSADKTRGEAAINLTLSGLTDGQSCTTFANVIPSTVTGNSDTADYKDTILKEIDPLSSCAPTISTAPTDTEVSIGTGVVEATDVATVGLTGGNTTPAGSVSFWLCDTAVHGATCDADEGESIGSSDVTGNSYPVEVTSPTAYITKAGDYCWRATWSGAGSGIPSASEDGEPGECFEVTAVTPDLTTEASDDTPAGGAVSDTAELSGTATQPVGDGISDEPIDPDDLVAAGGNIVFTLFESEAAGTEDDDEDACGALVYTSDPVDVTGDDDYDSPEFEPDGVGTYHWVATYSGNGPNTNGVSHNTDCDEVLEQVDVTDVPSTLETAQSWVPNDSATVSADGDALDGSVTFTLFASADCAEGTEVDAIDAETVDVSGASPQTVGTTNDVAVGAGTYSWQVSYDSDNPAQRDIPASCEETSVLTVDDGDPVSSP